MFFFLKFFCLETKEPKVQDLDLFAKKLIILHRKSLNWREFIGYASKVIDWPRVGQKGFLGGDG